MGGEWRKAKLGDVTTITSSKRIHRADYVECGVPFYRSKEVIERSNGRAVSTELFITEEQFRRIESKFGAPVAGDILLTSVGTLGIPFQVVDGDRFYFKDGNLTWFRNFSGRVDSRFLLLWLRSAIAKRRFDEITIGSTQKALTIVALKSIEFDLPPLPEQKAIAHILGSLDDKIELNRKMNETLETVARAIFKSWFVDFDPVLRNAIRAGNAIPPEYQERAERLKTQPDMSAVASAEGMDTETAKLFPNSFEDSELGMIPKGWRVGSGIDVADVGIGKTPPRKEKHWFSLDSTDMKWLSIRDMGAAGVYALDTSEYLTHEAIDRFNVRIAPANTVLLSFKLTVGRTVIAAEQMATNEAIAHFSLRDDAPLSSEYLFCYLKEFDYHSLGSTSSIATAVNSKTIKAMPILIPVLPAVDAFTESIAPVFSSIQAHLRQNEGLTQTRNALLPKLLSGQIRIKDAEKFMEDAA